MSEKIKFDLVSPDNILISGDVVMVTIPGGEGDYGVMFGHQPMITTIRPGVIETETEKGEISRFYVDGGFAEITNTECSVLAEDAIAISDFKKEDIDKRIHEAENNFDDLTNDLDISLNHTRLEVLKKILIEI
ncbi:MAG: ATP synthase F1 subunit epsilon [Rhodospirillaceae bacterium]|nr:ATP synthase F1 subunit epsilon [Rhodospirillaceae bacterium]|tara:strand:- start:3 stop:401 length:399 start_codon:yes stop_codon:yes gene_type:complete